MKHSFVLACVLAASAGCRSSERQEERTLPVLPAPAPSTTPSAPSPPPSLDQPLLAEDRVNASGKDEGAATGIDHTAEREIASSPELAAPGEISDRAITQRIRQAVMDDGSFSGSAKSIEIETVNGVVTLSGPVRTNQERAHLTTLASAMMGVKRVVDELQISGN